MTLSQSGSDTTSSAGLSGYQNLSGWGQSESCKISSGWGQAVPQEYLSGEGARSSSFAGSPGDSWDNFSGPIETWYNYRSITPEDWELFSEHQVVYSNGTNVDGLEPGWLVCGICSYKKTMSKDAMHTHIVSAKHKRNYDWFCLERSKTGGSAESGAPESKMLVTSEDRRMLEEHRCIVEDEWIVCTLCSKKMMDMSFLPDHIATRKHVNNLEWARSLDGRGPPDTKRTCLPDGMEVRGNLYYCTLCDASMAASALVDLHAESMRHQRNSMQRSSSQYMGGPVHTIAGFEVPIRKGPTLEQMRRINRGGNRTREIPPAPVLLPDLLDI